VGEPHILSAAAVLPESYADQETLLAAFRAHWGRKHFNLDRLEQLHGPSGSEAATWPCRWSSTRSSIPSPSATTPGSPQPWTSREGAHAGLLRADLRPHDLDHLYFVTVTGLATPSVDARLMDRMACART